MSAKLFIEFQNDVNVNSRPFTQKLNNNIRFLTFNVHMWKNFNNKLKYIEILEIIKDSNADVVGLQEAMLFDKKIAQIYKKDFEKLGYQHQVISSEKHGINMLFSKFPISSFKILKLKQDPIQRLNRYAILAVIDIGNPINLIVTHLDVYDESEQTRLDQIKSIINDLCKSEIKQTIIMGDFNSLRRNDYSQEDWNRITTHDLKRNVTSMTLVTDYLEQQHFTTNNLSMSVWAMRRVDYIYTKNLSYPITQRDTYPTGVSDHYPIYMDISM